MNVIELGYNYRLKRCDSMNWELEHFHLPIRNGKPTSDTPKWLKSCAAKQCIPAGRSANGGSAYRIP